MANRQDLMRAARLAIAGAWEEAHAIAQRNECDPNSCWLHAWMHKIEGDAGNARYWYARTGVRNFEDFAEPDAELSAAPIDLG